jgi:hypothetical protein
MISTGDTNSHPAARSALSDLVNFFRDLRGNRFLKLMTFRAFLAVGFLKNEWLVCVGVGRGPPDTNGTDRQRFLLGVEDALHGCVRGF